MAQFSLDIFTNIKSTIEDDFPRAVISHLVPNSFMEVIMFRQKMQIFPILLTAFNFLAQNRSIETIASMMVEADADYTTKPCGLDNKNLPWYLPTMTTCPFTLQPYLATLQSAAPKNITSEDYPSIAALLDPKVNISILNNVTGLPLWIGLSTLQPGALNFNSGKGFTMVTKSELSALSKQVTAQIAAVGYKSGVLSAKFQARVINNDILDIYSMQSGNIAVGQYILGPLALGIPNGTNIVEFVNGNYGGKGQYRLSKQINNFPRNSISSYSWITPNRLAATDIIVQALSYCIEVYWQPYLALTSNLLHDEFSSVSEPVTCSPVGPKCIYQWAYMREKYGNLHTFTPVLLSNLIDIGTMTGSNTANILYQTNVPTYYNAYEYCTNYFLKGIKLSKGCSTVNPKVEPAGSLQLPAAIWGADQDKSPSVAGLNSTLTGINFMKNDKKTVDEYIYLACNISTLVFDVFKSRTDYHDNYVVRFINNNKDKNLNHTFTVGEWKDLGYAQFGSGSITYALLQVKGIYQVVRDAMWYFGDEQYYLQLIEYSSHCIQQGYPYAFIWDVDESRRLLEALADSSDNGVTFRKNIAYRTTTYIGDGSSYLNGVGAVGDLAFTLNNGGAMFICDGVYNKTCDLLDVSITSSAEQCLSIEALYTVCVNQEFVGVSCKLLVSAMLFWKYNF